MTTLNNLVTSGALVSYEAALAIDELPERCLYLSLDLCDWLQNCLEYETRDRSKYMEPVEQVEQMFDKFVRGRDMMWNEAVGELDRIGKLDSIGSIWEFRPLDVRILGYFYIPNVFIAVCGDMKKNIKRRYEPLKAKVRCFRDELDIDPPKYEARTNINELIQL